jgi:hypothetical protein
MNLNSKSSQNLPSRLSKKQVDFENLERGKQRSKKGRPMDKTSKEDTKNHMDIP